MHQTSLALALDSSAGGIDLGRYFTAVGLLLAVLLGLAYGIKRLAGHAGRLRGSKRGLSIVEVLPLGGRRQLAVVRCYDRTFALGLGDKEISLVAELDPVEVPEGQVAQDAQEAQDTEMVAGQLEREVDPFTELIEKAQERLAGEGQLERPGPSSVRELSR